MRFSILLIFILINYPALGQRKKFMGFAPLNDTVQQEKKGFFVMPLLYYTPDTRWAAGGAGVYYFKIAPRDSTEKETRTDNIQFLADYTQNKQADFWASWNVFTRNENYLLKGDLRFRNFPDRFYGIGNSTQKSQMERYSYNLFQLKAMFLKKLKRDYFVGFDYEFEREYGFSYQAGGQLEKGTITGYKGGTGSAIGIVSLYDSRDYIINARKGSLFEISTYFFTPVLGSTFNFININGAYQKYWEIKKNHIIAIQAKTKINLGDVPFLDMSTLGSDDILRGYPKNRFRARNFAGYQTEYRFPLFWRFGMVLFAGAGDVFNHVNDLKPGLLKYSVGTGLRFIVNPAEKLNIRVDYAQGREGGYFYFVVAEAF